MAPNNWKPVWEKHEQEILPTFLYQMKKIKRQDAENELQKLMFSRVGKSASFLSQMMKIKREDEDNENDLHRLMYSRVG
jgi:hypothetical protein